MLKLMCITPDPKVATIAMNSGVDRIFVDMEVIGKGNRQKGMDTVQSKHSFEDIKAVKQIMQSGCELLVRSNPIHSGSKREIEKIIECGADIVMLPYFQRAEQVMKFVDYVAGRAKVCLLIESREAIDNLDSILAVDGADEYYIGLNDLHLDYKMSFMFEPLANGMLDDIVAKISKMNRPYGFGGVACIGDGALKGESIVMEHYRLGSSMVILSRTFCNSALIEDLDELEMIFKEQVQNIRLFESMITDNDRDCDLFVKNHADVSQIVNNIING